MILEGGHSKVYANTITFDDDGFPTVGSAWTGTALSCTTGDRIIGLVYDEEEEKFKAVFDNALESSNSTIGLRIYESEDGITWENANYDTGVAYEDFND